MSFFEAETHSVCFQKLVDWDAISDLELKEELEAGYSMEVCRTQLGPLEETIGVAAIEELFGIVDVHFRGVGHDYRLLKVPSEGDLFCMIHAGKPLASFCLGLDDDEQLMLTNQNFPKFVEAGVIEKHEFLVDLDGRPIRQLLFSLKGHRWRAELMESLKRHLYTSSWSPHLEAIESYLLGYNELPDDWMTQCHERRRRDLDAATDKR